MLVGASDCIMLTAGITSLFLGCSEIVRNTPRRGGLRGVGVKLIADAESVGAHCQARLATRTLLGTFSP